MVASGIPRPIRTDKHPVFSKPTVIGKWVKFEMSDNENRCEMTALAGRVSYGHQSSRLVYDQSMTIDREPIVTVMRNPPFRYLR